MKRIVPQWMQRPNRCEFCFPGKEHKLKKHTRGLFLLFFLFCSVPAWAQSGFTVSGTVKDDSGTDLPGVNVLLKGTSTAAPSDVQGNYSLTVPDGNGTLVFSFIGYQSQEVPINNRTTINVTLATDAKALEEVVVVGYGTARKKDVTGSIAQVSAEDLNPGINTNALGSIQGKVAGLTVTQPSGDPNQTPTVRLRGYTSLAGGSDPLYVVDGVIGVPITSVAPGDIESMDVLKDASAAAIYGSRAANGVIIITTKKGRAGKATVNFNNYIGVETISNQLELLDADAYRAQVARIKGEASLSDNLRFPTGPGNNGFNTDWMDEISRKAALTNNHDLALTGGNEAFNYRGSLNYIKREGIIKKTDFERVTARFNADQSLVNDKLNIQYSLSYSNRDSRLSNNDVIAEAITFLPTLPIYSPTGSTNFGGYYEVEGSFDLNNPVAMQNNYQNDEQNRVLIGGLNLRYEILNGLTLGANGAYRQENTVNSGAYNNIVKGYTGRQGGANAGDYPSARSLYQTNNKLLDLTATYARGLGESSNFSILAGYSYQNNIDDGFSARNSSYILGGYELFGYNNLGAGQGSLLSGRSDYTTSYKNEWSLVSFFGRATFNLLDKYNITATIRRDGSSKFGANNKWGTFPSFAAGWTISDEEFLKGSSTLSYLKLRAGWGQTGNSEGISPYQSIRLYGVIRNYYDGSVGDYVPGYGYVQNANPNLRWEILEQTNLGLDFTLFNKLSGSIDVYNKLTKDMLYPYTVPADGINYVTSSILANVGEMRNRGVELSLGADVINNGNFSWNVNTVASYNKNEIVSLTGDGLSVGVIRYNAFGGRGLSDVFASRLSEGRPLGEFLIPHFVGYDQNGKVLLEAADGGEATTDYSKARLHEAGTALPKYTASLVNSFQYKNFDLNFQLRGAFGHKILNNLRSNLTIPGSILETNMLEEIADYPLDYSTNQLSDKWLENASFVRLDNWQIGYNIPVKGGVLKNARVYVGGNNLFIITGYKGIDPELEVKGDLQTSNGVQQQAPNSVGLDNSSIYPKTRSLQLGVNLTL